MPTAVNITFVSAPLPEGWRGTPDEFREQIFSTLTAEVSGTFLTGQMGGAMPTSNVGLFVDGQSIYTWDEDTSAYKPITTVPVGGAIPYFGATAPDGNWLICDGASYLREDYPDLFAVIGDNFNQEADDDDHFRVPHMQGRTAYGAGIGDYDPQDIGTYPGKMQELTLGDYVGREWPQRAVPRHVNQPAAAAVSGGSVGEALYYSGGVGGAGSKYTRTQSPGVVANWIIRAK